ncbi:hypothetical protein TWF281_006843 [Arthrobotrys megalospora]
MNIRDSLTIFIALISLTNALPAAIPTELTTEDILKLAEGHPPPGFELRRRAACNADNALRALRDQRYSSSASAFCSVFIQSTITDIVSAPATVTTETMQTPPPTSITVTDVSTSTETDSSTVTSFSPITDLPTQNIAKRSEIPYPPWLTASYPPSRISSACSCFITAPLPPTHVTNTVITGTVTAFSKTITLPPVVSTITESVTTVVTTTAVVSAPKVIHCNVVPACRRLDRPPSGLSFDVSREDCRTSCVNTPGCLSIQWGGPGTSACFLSGYSVADTWAEISLTSSICNTFFMDDVECVYVS